jgi:hypothetical protein
MAGWRTQARTALSVMSSSRATTPIDFPLSPTSRTVRALNPSVNARRFRLAMDHSYRTFVRSAVLSTKPGQDQFRMDAAFCQRAVFRLLAARAVPMPSRSGTGAGCL